MALFSAIAFFGLHQSMPGHREKEAEANKYYSTYAILLKGAIIDKRRADEGLFPGKTFTYTVKIAESNVSEHDLRGYNEDYYLVIRNDTARYQSFFSLTGEPGDSIIIDYAHKRQLIWKGQEPKQEYDLPAELGR